jgi:hypothetical protein
MNRYLPFEIDFYNLFSYEGLLIIAFLLLSISERWYVRYQFLGRREIAAADILFFIVASLFLTRCIKNDGIRYITRKMRRIWHILLPLLLLILHHLVFGSVSTSAAFRLVGLGMVMLISFLMLTKYSIDKIMEFISRYVLIFVVLFLLSYISTRILDAYGLLVKDPIYAAYGLFPFEGHQSGLFGIFILMLAVGVFLTNRKHYMLYWVVPIMFLVIAQEGSRTNNLLLVYTWIGFWVLFFAQEKFLLKKKLLGALHLILCTYLTIIILFLNFNSVMKRSFSYLTVSPIYLLFGADDVRKELWSHLSPYKEGVVMGTHNIYLDYFYYNGIFALMLFILFLFSLLISALIVLWRNRTSKNYPFYLAVCPIVLIVMGDLYVNTHIAVRFIWAFFGLVMALWYIDNKELSDSKLKA